MTAAKDNPSADNEHTGENEIFGPYEVYERLGVGGMATVHRAKERGIEGFERIVALKRLLPHLAEDESFVRSFVREAKLASLLRHANIVQLYELGRVGAVYFIAMELIEGRDVRRILRQARRVSGPPPLSVYISLMTQLCDALDYAHKRTDDKGEPLGIVHRDVSPSNLIITNSGHLKIIDFGIAKAQTEQLRTSTGRIKGKLAYMAPEAIKGHKLDARSDVWAAGVIAHELLTARPLFASKNEYQTLMRVQSSEIAPPSKHNENCPPELDDVVLMALARDPADRWQTAAEFRDGLEYIRSHFQVSAKPSDVAEWMDWAFSQKGSTTSSFGASGSGTGMTPSQLSGPQRAFERARSRAANTTGAMRAFSTKDIERLKASDEQDVAEDAAEQAAEQQAASFKAAPEPEPDIAFNDADAGFDADDDEDEGEGGYAWGEDGGKPLLLDDVPDVSHKSLSAVSLPANTQTGFGAGIISEGAERGRNNVIIAVSVLAAIVGVLVTYFLILRGPEKETAVTAKADTGMIKFRVEPVNATIAVLGYGKHTGTPYELEVDAPGIYSIEISHKDHKTYITEFQVEAGVKQILAVALQKKSGGNMAEVKLESKPIGKRIFLDGQDTGYRTPHLVQMTPGRHTLVLKGDEGAELWKHEIIADIDKQYVFSPSVENLTKLAALEKEKTKREARKSRDRQKRRRASRGDKSERDVVDEQPKNVKPVASTIGELTTATPLTPPPEDKPDPVAKPEDKPDPVAKPEDKPDPVAKPEDKPNPVEKKDPVEPKKDVKINILPHQAKKISGKMPSLTIDSRRAPKVGSAKVCISKKGRVSSVSVLTKQLGSRAKSEVKSAVKKWRYKTHRVDGQAVEACFAIQFRIKAN